MSASSVRVDLALDAKGIHTQLCATCLELDCALLEVSLEKCAPERENTIHCWTGGENCAASNESLEAKSESSSQVGSRGLHVGIVCPHRFWPVEQSSFN